MTRLRLFSAAAIVLALSVSGPAMGPSMTWAGPPSSDDTGLSGVPSLAAMQNDIGATPVTARLVALDTGVQPGRTVRVGLRLSHEPKWHTYWRNGGDSGLPTEIQWDLPEGFDAGPIVWPTPERIVDAADLVTYGFSGEVMLFTDLTVPTDARGALTLRARVDWLMCKDLCIPGGQDVELTLVVGGPGVVASDADRSVWESSLARVPVAASTLDAPRVRGVLDVSAVPAGQKAYAAVLVEGLVDPSAVRWTWFPLAVDGLFPAGESSQVDGDRLALLLPFEIEPSVDAEQTLAWGGVVELEDAQGRLHFVSVDVPVRIAGTTDAVEAIEPELFASLLGVSADAVGGFFDQDFTERTGGSGRGLLYYLALALVGGIILNVMPCVLPVLSLKIMSFVQHAGEQRGVQLRLGLTFAAGVLTSFLVLAGAVIALQAAGDQLGWGFQFQNPTFVVIMAAVVFAFGLSLFGVYEIVLPVQLGGGGRGGAYAESFFNGVLATVLATPCTAPFLGTALGFAFTQPAAAIVAIFLTIGVGLSLPYVILSVNPQWLRFVPRPGAWMNRFKQGMGFLLMATLVWLLWVLGQQIGLDGVVWTLVFLLCLGFSLWLYGSAVTLSSGTTRRLVVWGLMIAIVVGAWWRFLAGPLSAEAIASTKTDVATTTHGDGAVEWKPFSVALLEQEVAAGNTVMLDFTAAWCTTCKVNEKTVLATGPVEKKLQELGVVTLLGDWTHRDEEITRVLRRFGRSGVPFYAVFPAGRIDAPIVLPELITQDIVLNALEQAGPSRAAAASR